MPVAAAAAAAAVAVAGVCSITTPLNRYMKPFHSGTGLQSERHSMGRQKHSTSAEPSQFIHRFNPSVGQTFIHHVINN
jgi:hypothetical protein